MTLPKGILLYLQFPAQVIVNNFWTEVTFSKD